MSKTVFAFWGVFVVAAIVRVAMSFDAQSIDVDGCLKRPISGTGMVATEPERKEGGQAFILEAKTLFPATSTDEMAHTGACAQNIRIRAKTKLYPRLTYGDEIVFSGSMSRPFNFTGDTGRTFDYQGFLAKDDVYYEMKSVTVHEIGEHKKSVQSALFWLKRNFVAHLEETLGEPHSALAAGLVVGEKSALGKDLLEDFRIVGLIHIIVLSGFNITIVGDAMRRALAFLPRVWGIVIGGIGIVLFGIMVGGGATVVRSCFMAVIALSADLIRRDYQVMKALILAGLIMIILNPLILLDDPSFQLSFLATLGLILLASPIEGRLEFITERFGIRGIVASTIATQIFVSPFILYMMGTMSIIGMVVNVLVLPIIPITMLTVFLTGALGFVWQPLSQLFAWISHLLLSYELSMVNVFAQVPYAAIDVPPFSFWWVVGFYVVFTVVYFLINRRTKNRPMGGGREVS